VSSKNKRRKQLQQAVVQNPSSHTINSSVMVQNYHVNTQSLPSADEINKFAVIDSGLPKKIMDDALEHSKAARENEKKVVASVTADARANRIGAYVQLGILGSAVFGILGLGIYLVIAGKSVEGLVCFLPSLGVIVQFLSKKK
jgi:hypothetical protein